MAAFAPPRGTQDILPMEWQQRHLVLDAARRRFQAAGYGRIATPTFEDTALFHRGVGEGTDIVSKETYDFEDRGGRSITLRPEGTAPVARAYVNHGMHREPLPVKLWYFGSMFRYEKPQAGRLREFYQIGCEVLGSDEPAVEAELISILTGLHTELRIPDVTLHLNSVGSSAARAAYRDALVAYLTPHAAQLDPDSQNRLATNPLRILDSKHESTRAIVADAPQLPDYLTTEDRAHYDEVARLLAAAGVTFVHDPLLVRGLDYYTRTVFEFRCSALGAQDTISAGGRYDGLVEALGGPATPAVGFASGIERMLLAIHAGDGASAQRAVDVWVGAHPDGGNTAREAAFVCAQRLRDFGHSVELDLLGRSPKGQAKQAARLGARIRVLATEHGLMMFARGEFEGTELLGTAQQSAAQMHEVLSA